MISHYFNNLNQLTAPLLDAHKYLNIKNNINIFRLCCYTVEPGLEFIEFIAEKYF